jgi:riboflavin synthase
MFTGLVEARSPVRAAADRGAGRRLCVLRPPGFDVRAGDSICVSGVCLTVAGDPDGDLEFDLSAETLARTSLGEIGAGEELNLERAMRLSDRLDGHLVAGHVDGRGRVAAVRDPRDGGRTITIEVEPGFERYLVDKGSVAVDGVSLTVVSPRGRMFDVAVIPVTLEKTTLGRAEPGRVVNLEADLIGKWIERLVRSRD